LLANIKPIHTSIDKRKRFKEGVVNPVRQSSIECGEEDGWVKGVDFPWLNQGVEYNLARVHVRLLDLGLGF
jgi:hypothetical protein